ncbi:Uncharacterised protein [Mycobacteroides abscessus subsp. abscessus]|nr:Uncharacterised protein [Mycobacteroides abscessus subsp. abscessus]
MMYHGSIPMATLYESIRVRPLQSSCMGAPAYWRSISALMR